MTDTEVVTGLNLAEAIRSFNALSPAQVISRKKIAEAIGVSHVTVRRWTSSPFATRAIHPDRVARIVSAIPELGKLLRVKQHLLQRS